MIKKICFFSIITFLIGVYIGKNSKKNSPVMQTRTISKAKVVNIKDDIQIDEANKKLAQAKELYSKAFLLLLADLGLNINKEIKDKVMKVFNNPSDYISYKQKNTPSQNSLVDYARYEKEKNINFKVIDHIEDQALIKRTKKFVLKKPLHYYAETSYIENFTKEVKNINGHYTGQLFITEGSNAGSTDDIILNVDFTMAKDKKIDGNFTLKLIRDGHPYSTSNGTGGNRNLRGHPKHANSIIVESSPSSFIHFRDLSLNYGNYYKNNKFMGLVKLAKHE